MSEPWLVFYHGEKELCAYTLRGSFDGEAADTAALLASERGILVSEIRTAVELRGDHVARQSRTGLRSEL